MTRIGVISDTHMEFDTAAFPKKILDDFKNVDMIIHAGDLGSLKVLELLKSACKNVYAVRGNMDPHTVAGKLPEKEIIKVGRYKIGVTHGIGAPARLLDLVKEKFKDDPVDVVVFGHSHQPFNEKIGGVLFFNPGSPVDKMFAPYNSYGILLLNDNIEGQIIKI
ncbi:MAG: metallophosphoesterase family protein [Candidatus Babeliales bacterium]